MWQANGVVLDSTASSWSYPMITSDGSGGAIVAWVGPIGEVYAQKIDASGNLNWPDSSVLLAPKGSEPQIISDDAGGAIVCWYRYNPEMTNTNVFAQRVDTYGNVLWLATGDTICHAQGYQTNCELAPDNHGGAIIVWMDSRSDTGSYVYAQHVNAAGAILWPKNGIQVSTIRASYRTRLASDSADGAILTWVNYQGSELYAQRINGSQVLQWSGDVRITLGGSPNGPRIVADGSGGAVIVWETTAGGYVRAQHVDQYGTPTFPNGGKTIFTQNYYIGRPIPIMDGRGGTIITFEAMPYYDMNIYVDRTSIPGLTGVEEGEISGIVPREFEMSQNFPNPFNPSTQIEIALPAAGNVSMRIYDVLGREVTKLLAGHHNAGRYTVTWDASSLGSGVYFARLMFKAENSNQISTKNIKLLLAK